MKPYNHSHFINLILYTGIFLSLTTGLFGADAPITTVGTLNDAVPGKPVTVPVMVTGFTNVGSFYLYLEYDSSKLQFSSLTKNPALTGNYDTNDIDIGNGLHRIILSYSGGIYGINLPDSSSIADIVFEFISGPAEIKFNTSRDNYCKYTDPHVNKLNDTPKSTYYNSGVVASLVPSAPGIGLIIQPNYEVPTGSVELSGLPPGNWTINPGAIEGTGSNYTISGLPAGSYNFTVTNEQGYLSAPSHEVIINNPPITSVDIFEFYDANTNGDPSISIFPNPFKRNPTIEYSLPADGMVTIYLYNQLGQKVESLVDEIQIAGKYSIAGNFDMLEPGIYIARITVIRKQDSKTAKIKLTVLK